MLNILNYFSDEQREIRAISRDLRRAHKYLMKHGKLPERSKAIITPDGLKATSDNLEEYERNSKFFKKLLSE